MIAIGIDPGLTGAMSLLCLRRGLLDVVDLPVCANGQDCGKLTRWIDVLALSGQLRAWGDRFGTTQDPVTAFIERPIAMPGQQISTAASSFDCQGAIRAVMAMRMYDVHMVTPNEWKKFYKLGKDKDESRRIAAGLYPDAPLTRKRDHNRAEAILIARYGMRMVA